ncbi:MAG: hypothetical protein CMJ39_12160 [Phycisphaerae bacterium]|nr:hypothetical protein [Phycisphaerae bacterium]
MGHPKGVIQRRVPLARPEPVLVSRHPALNCLQEGFQRPSPAWPDDGCDANRKLKCTSSAVKH